MNRKQKIILIISFISMLLIFGGVTYAYFTANITNTESQSTIVVTGGVLNIRYDNLSNTITVENIYPRDAAWVVKNFTVTGTNTTDLKMNYKVGLNVVSNTFSANELSATLENTNTAAEKEALDGTPVANTTKNVPASSTVWFGSGQFETTDPNEVHKYTLSIYYPETNTNQNANQQKAFTGKVVIEEDGTGEIDDGAAPEHWNDAPAGSLLAGIKANNASPSAPLTTPGVEASSSGTQTISVSELCGGESDCEVYYGTSAMDVWWGYSETSGNYSTIYNNLAGKWIVDNDWNNTWYVISATASNLTVSNNATTTTLESLLLSTEDDYGTSYYYRGAVENNYVSFAGMCWRIVRIDGLGNIKLVLYNYNPNSATNPCAASEDGETNAFARYSGSTYTSEFNTNYNKNAYVGFMYGTPGSSSYEAEHANTNDSTILTNLKTWYDAKFSAAQKALLADVIWCNDKRVVSDTTYDVWNYSSILGTGAGTDKTYYQATQRLIPYNSTTSSYDTTNASPSLKCGISKTDNLISKYTASISTDGGYGNGALAGYKIGLLTADEIAFAGGYGGGINHSYYLNKNATETFWWSLSPNDFNGGYAYGWSVNDNGYLYGGTDVRNSFGVRPSVSLVSTASITSGTGTQSSPFIIGS